MYLSTLILYLSAFLGNTIPLKINYFSPFDDISLDKSFFRTLTIFFVILFFVFVYVYFRPKAVLRPQFSDIYVSKNAKNQEYQICFLYVGLFFIIMETALELFHVRPKSLFISNMILGISLITIYFVSNKVKFIFNNIHLLFKILFCLFTLYVTRNIVLSPNDSIPYIGFVILFLFSYNVLKPIKLYWFFAAALFAVLSFLYIFNLIPAKSFIVLFNYSLIVFCINFIRHISFLNIRNEFRFSNEILNNGNSITIAINNKKEVVFCSQSILPILGYSSDEVMGLHFLELTKSEALIDEIFNQTFIVDTLFHKKIKCKDDTFKHIQWSCQKYSDELFIVVGQDISKQIKLQKSYENLVESAHDIIYELDRDGNYLFINKNTETITGYSLKELFNSNFKELIRSDYKEIAFNFYYEKLQESDNFPILEFPIISKDGNEIWLSQKVSTNRNELGNLIGYYAIARDITYLKISEKEKFERQTKNQKYSAALKTFTEISYSNKYTQENKIQTVLKTVSDAMDMERVSFWDCLPSEIICSNLYLKKQDSFVSDLSIQKKDYPNYFSIIEQKNQIVVADVHINQHQLKFCNDYFPANNILSLLDTPVLINGELRGIICIECTDKIRNWDNEDINFARSISDILSIIFESKMRLDIEQKLRYKSDLLAAMTLCTEKFLKSKDINEIFADVLIIMGKATQSHRAYYYLKNSGEDVISQKYRWIMNNTSLTENNPNLQNLPYEFFEELLTPLLNNKIYQATVSHIENISLKTKLQGVDVASLILFPVFVKGEFHGFIGFDDTTQERPWSEDEANILQTLARNIASAIERLDSELVIYESEEKFRLLANNIPGTVYLSENDEQFTKIYLNDEIEKLTGYNKNDFLEKRIIYIDLIHPEDREILRNKALEQLNKPEPYHLTYRIIKKDNQIAWVEEFGDAIIKNGKIGYFEGIMLDITKKVEADQAIERQKYAEAASIAKSEFLANMSHEIRTPLNGIIGFTDLLMKTTLSKNQQKHMDTVNQSAHSLLGIVNDILDFSKIEAGKLELYVEKIEIHELFNQIIDLISFESNVKKLDLQLIVAPDVPKYFWIDIVRVKQILINLLTNAVKFTNSGFVKLEITNFEEISSSINVIRFAVIDSGIGILDSNKDRIFNAFSQEDSSTTKKFGGTGLGLTISNKLLDLMGSQLKLTSQINVGSTFYFDLKIKTSNKYKIEDSSLTKNIEAQYLENIAHLKNTTPTIMLVEDNKINMLLLKTIVKNIFSKVTIFEIQNGQEAMEQFEAIKPDIIFMDIQMPIVNGYEATKAIRKLVSGKDIPIIAITAGAEKEEKDKCISVGMNDYISKPIVKGIIEEKLAFWLR